MEYINKYPQKYFLSYPNCSDLTSSSYCIKPWLVTLEPKPVGFPLYTPP